jgi:hypothetical protein
MEPSTLQKSGPQVIQSILGQQVPQATLLTVA